MGQLHVMPTPNPLELAWYPPNDDGNAERLAARSQGLLRWVDLGDGQGFWIAYKDGRWRRDIGLREARLAAKDVARRLIDEAKALHTQITEGKLPPGMSAEVAQDRLTELRKWSRESGNSNRARNMLDQAQSLLAVSIEEFDADPYAFNCRNGTLRFHRIDLPPGAPEEWGVQLHPHNPEDMISRMAEVEFDPLAACPGFLKRLERLQPEADQREFMRRIFGYAVQGLRSEQVFVVAQGKGGDGKSLTHVVFSAIFGDYYKHADVQSFLQGGRKSGSDHSEDLARLAGDTRLVTCDEPERGSVWNSKVIKQMTGGGKMTVRALREASREIRPGWLLIVECNTFPRVPTSDDGFWRRCKVLEWPVQLDRSQQGDFEAIKGALLSERSGILNWMIGGALTWLAERNLSESARAVEVRESYRNSSDPFGEWYRARCVTGARDQLCEQITRLHEDFQRYCRDEIGVEEDKVPKIRAFGTMLSERQHPSRKSNGVMMRYGLRLKTDAEIEAASGASDAAERARAAAAAVPEAPPAWPAARDDTWVPGDD
jgi:putative DNA primase/helicase